MANWNLPTITSGYLDFVTEMNDKIADAGTIGFGAPTNLPDHAIRYNRSIDVFEEWNLTVWTAKLISIAGGGTGAATASAARTNLGLGSMATQNNNAVNITGGSISGVNFSASDLTSGVVALARGGTGASLALGAPGTVLLSNGTNVVFAPGTQIAQLNASNLTTGIVPRAQLPAQVAYVDAQNLFTGRVDFAGYTTFSPTSFPVTIVQANPNLNFYDTLQPVDQHYLRIMYNSGSFVVQGLTDGFGLVATYFSASRFGLVVGDGTNPIYANGSPLTNLNASNLASGIVPIARLSASSPVAGTFLRSDGTWAFPETGGGGGVPSGLIAIFASSCPSGWSRISQLDNRFPIGGTSWGSTGGSTSHSHSVHITPILTGESDANIFVGSQGAGPLVATAQHKHELGVHGNTDNADFWPPYLTVVFCEKN